MSKPTILLVPGSFSPSALFYNSVAIQLRNLEYEVIAIELPTIGPPSTAPPKSMEDDAAHIHGIAEALIDDGKDVVIVMNSYGGIPGTQAVNGLSKTERKGSGVVGLVYLTALLINVGEASTDSMGSGGGIPDYVKIRGDYMWLEPNGNAENTFSYLPREQGLALAKAMPGHATQSFSGKLTSSSHYDIPITYLKCTEDKVVLPTHQQKMIDDIKKVSRSSVNVIEIASGHAPMISHVDDTVQAILKAC